MTVGSSRREMIKTGAYIGAAAATITATRFFPKPADKTKSPKALASAEGIEVLDNDIPILLSSLLEDIKANPELISFQLQKFNMEMCAIARKKRYKLHEKYDGKVLSRASAKEKDAAMLSYKERANKIFSLICKDLAKKLNYSKPYDKNVAAQIKLSLQLAMQSQSLDEYRSLYGLKVDTAKRAETLGFADNACIRPDQLTTKQIEILQVGLKSKDSETRLFVDIKPRQTLSLRGYPCANLIRNGLAKMAKMKSEDEIDFFETKDASAGFICERTNVGPMLVAETRLKEYVDSFNETTMIELDLDNVKKAKLLDQAVLEMTRSVVIPERQKALFRLAAISDASPMLALAELYRYSEDEVVDEVQDIFREILKRANPGYVQMPDNIRYQGLKTVLGVFSLLNESSSHRSEMPDFETMLEDTLRVIGITLESLEKATQDYFNAHTFDYFIKETPGMVA